MAISNNIRKATLETVKFILDNLRDQDRQELFDSMGPGYEKTFYDLIYDNEEVKICCDDNGTPFMLFGYKRLGLVSRVPFMIATKNFNTNFILASKVSKDYVATIKKGCNILVNIVPTNNKRTVKWLAWLGFRMQGTQKCGYNKDIDFTLFTLEGEL